MGCLLIVVVKRAELSNEHFLRDLHCGQCSWCAAVTGSVDNGFGDFGAGQTVGEGTLDVAAQFLGGSQGHEHSNVEQGAITLGQPFAAPDRTPDCGGDVLLQGLSVGAGVAREGGIDEFVAHYLAADLDTGIVAVGGKEFIIGIAHAC